MVVFLSITTVYREGRTEVVSVLGFYPLGRVGDVGVPGVWVGELNLGSLTF